MIDGLIYHRFTRTWKPPYTQRCRTCGKMFIATVANKAYCSYACTPDKSRPIPKEDGMIQLKVKYVCEGCGELVTEYLFVSNKAARLGTLFCRACVGRNT